MAFMPGTLLYLCDKSIGLTFFDEVRATGLIEPHYSVMLQGYAGAPAAIEFFEDTPQETIDIILGVYELHDSTSGVEAELAAAARVQRDSLLRTYYDPGILMAQRALRMASTPEEESYAEGKIIELDNYAELLQDVPEQIGFPQTINWPVAPIR